MKERIIKKKTLNQQLYKTFYQKLCNHIIIYFFFFARNSYYLDYDLQFFFPESIHNVFFKKKKSLKI